MAREKRENKGAQNDNQSLLALTYCKISFSKNLVGKRKQSY